MKIVILANTVHTNTLTGGDKIFVECAKRWIARRHDVTIITNEVGRTYCVNSGIAPAYITVWCASVADTFGVFAAMMTKTIVSVIRGVLFLPKKGGRDVRHIVFSP